MRYRLMATYLGVPYHAGLGPDGNEATLFSPGPPPDELGFTPAGGHWRKQVSVTDLGALWQSRLVGEYRGEPCLVLDDLGDRLHIAYQGRDSARARQLGYWEIDREVFEVVVARQDVTGLTEERVEYPLDAAMFPASNRDPVAQMRPEAPGRGPGGPQAAGERRRPAGAALGRRADQPAAGGARGRDRSRRPPPGLAGRRAPTGPVVEHPGPDGRLARLARCRALAGTAAGLAGGSRERPAARSQKRSAARPQKDPRPDPRPTRGPTRGRRPDPTPGTQGSDPGSP